MILLEGRTGLGNSATAWTVRHVSGEWCREATICVASCQPRLMEATRGYLQRQGGLVDCRMSANQLRYDLPVAAMPTW